MSYILQVERRLDGTATPLAGRYVRSWNPHVGRDESPVVTTAWPEEAQRFDHVGDIVADWFTISRVDPVRPDGRPNRPLADLKFNILSVDK